MSLLNLSQWDFKTKHVQPDDMAGGTDFVSSESIVICAAKMPEPGTNPSERIITPDLLVPIGVLDNASVIQNKQIQQVFEIGSKIPFFIPGRTFIQANLTRVVFNGDSLLRVLYPVNPDQAEPHGPDAPGSHYNTVKHFYANLASSFFNHSLDLAFIVQDSESEPMGALVLRDCFIQTYQMSITGQQTIVMENCSLRCSRIESLTIEGITPN